MGNEFFVPGYEDEFMMGAEAAGAGVLGVIFAIYGLVILLSLAFSTAVYILHSLGLYTIGTRRGIRNSWLAWVPVGNLWLLGSISDQYQYVVKGKVKNRRKVLLGLSIAYALVYVVWFVALMASIVFVAGDPYVTGGAGAIMIMILSAVAVLIVALILLVFEYICYYDLFCSCERNNGALYLILSIVFVVVLPFLVFACRKKDGGMPPRKQPAQPVIEPVVEPIVEPTVEPVAEGFAQPEEFEE